MITIHVCVIAHVKQSLRKKNIREEHLLFFFLPFLSQAVFMYSMTVFACRFFISHDFTFNTYIHIHTVHTHTTHTHNPHSHTYMHMHTLSHTHAYCTHPYNTHARTHMHTHTHRFMSFYQTLMTLVMCLRLE